MKEKQKNWIMETAKREYDHFVRKRGKLPVHGSKQQLIERIYAQVEAKCIRIPYGEVKRTLDNRIAHWNRQAQRLGEDSECGAEESAPDPAGGESVTRDE